MARQTLTSTQFAYLFKRAEFLRRMRERAMELFEQGYRVSADPFSEETVFTVSNPEGEEYVVNPVLHTCTCPFFHHQETAPLEQDGRVACKHLRGFSLLVKRTLEAHIRAGKLMDAHILLAAYNQAKEAHANRTA